MCSAVTRPEAGENHLSLAQRRLVLVGGFDHGDLDGRGRKCWRSARRGRVRRPAAE